VDNQASAVSNDPSLNFILYVAAASQRPLKIHDAKGKPTANNAFLLPRWGGVVISNPNTDGGNQFGYALEDLKPVMEIFVAQLRALLGIRELLGEGVKVGDDIQVQHAPAPPTAVTAWELDALTRRRIAESVITSVSTLRSLALLISEIPNMVVLDHIQTEVTEALECLRKSTAALRNRKYAEALQHARHALLLSETAFFDPTMVSMLYFPDEHRYAIYMPLFVPISVPLVAALVREIKEAKRRMRR
jgi:phosphatidylinositol glycan class S